MMPGSSQNITGNRMMDEALRYVQWNWPVIPLHTPRADGSCDCNRDDCDRVGKHPRVYRGLLDASLNPADIRTWWEAWPHANIGIVTGVGCGAYGVGVIDIDPRHGGDETFTQLLANLGFSPRTVTAVTGSGGSHLFYRLDNQQLRNSVGTLGEGVDIRGDGGFVVASPSLHVSGRRYYWAPGWSPLFAELEPFPDVLRQKLGSKTSAIVGGVRLMDGAKMVEGQRNMMLSSLAGAIRRKGCTETEIAALLSSTNETRCQPPLSQAEVHKIVHSIARYESGWMPPGESSNPDAERAHAITLAQLAV